MNNENSHLVIVSGSARSGTSLMMQILESGGIPLFYDNTKPPDQNNPYGYFEKAEMFLFSGDPDRNTDFIGSCQNKAVKILPPSILPRIVTKYPNTLIKIVFMLRDEVEVANSYITMLEEMNKLDNPGSPFYGLSREDAMNLFKQKRSGNIQIALDFFQTPENTADVLIVDHNKLMTDTLTTTTEISNFIRNDLPQYEMNPTTMANIVNLDLYRQRQSIT